MDPNRYLRLSDADKDRIQNRKLHEEAMGLERKHQNSEWVRWVVTTVIAAIAMLVGSFGFLNSIFGWFTVW